MPDLKPTICFDLDGTLIDTAPDLLNALDHCLITDGFEKADRSAIRPIIGNGAKAMIEQSLEIQAKKAEAITPARLEALWEIMINHYAANITAESRPFEGVEAALKALKKTGFPLAVITNKPLFLTIPLLDTLDLTHLFDQITGGDSYPHKKPDPRTLHETVRQAGGTPPLAIMVGDSKTDIDTALNANTPSIGVTFGYTEQTMQSLNPDKLMTHFDQLEGFVGEIVLNLPRQQQ